MENNNKSKTSLLSMMNPEIEIDQDKSKWLWRYMDLSKFIRLLTQKAIFFPNASLFEDKREGLTRSF